MSDMSDTAQYSDWLTKSQVATVLGVSEKSVERFARAGKIQSAARKNAGSPPMVVFHPADVERERAARNQPAEAFVVPQAQALVRQQTLEMSKTEPRVVFVQQANPAVFLTTQQAAEYSGLSEDFLLKLVRNGKLKRLSGCRGFRYKRTDLDGLQI